MRLKIETPPEVRNWPLPVDFIIPIQHNKTINESIANHCCLCRDCKVDTTKKSFAWWMYFCKLHIVAMGDQECIK